MKYSFSVVSLLLATTAGISAKVSPTLFCFRCHRGSPTKAPVVAPTPPPNTGLIMYSSTISLDVGSTGNATCGDDCIEVMRLTSAFVQEIDVEDIANLDNSVINDTITFTMDYEVPVAEDYYDEYGEDMAPLQYYKNTTSKLVTENFQTYLQNISEALHVDFLADAVVADVEVTGYTHMIREPTFTPTVLSTSNGGRSVLVIGLSMAGIVIFGCLVLSAGRRYYYMKRKRLATVDMSDLPYTFPIDVMPGAVMDIHGEARVVRCDPIATGEIDGQFIRVDSPKRKRIIKTELFSQSPKVELSLPAQVPMDVEDDGKYDELFAICSVDLERNRQNVQRQSVQLSGRKLSESSNDEKADDRDICNEQDDIISDSGSHKETYDDLISDDDSNKENSFDPNDPNKPFVGPSGRLQNDGLAGDNEADLGADSECRGRGDSNVSHGYLEIASQEALAELEVPIDGSDIEEGYSEESQGIPEDLLEGLPMSNELQPAELPTPPPIRIFTLSLLFAERGLQAILYRWKNRSIWRSWGSDSNLNDGQTPADPRRSDMAMRTVDLDMPETQL